MEPVALQQQPEEVPDIQSVVVQWFQWHLRHCDRVQLWPVLLAVYFGIMQAYFINVATQFLGEFVLTGVGWTTHHTYLTANVAWLFLAAPLTVSFLVWRRVR